jgi:hypothetical protein
MNEFDRPGGKYDDLVIAIVVLAYLFTGIGTFVYVCYLSCHAVQYESVRKLYFEGNLIRKVTVAEVW